MNMNINMKIIEKRGKSPQFFVGTSGTFFALAKNVVLYVFRR